ncbi:Programmed cell death protein 2 C-terminal [Trinorchestia longiramus]|nr:Programmed cell death protein 2 C-terminal [Trinorchestia longiramus]
MACQPLKQSPAMPVLLGFVDEEVCGKNELLVNHKVSKIGGKPDWPTLSGCTSPVCSSCGVTQVLILQIYAPLHSSPDHRTLYIFACLTPLCWGTPHSWTCIRVQWPASPIPESSGQKSVGLASRGEENSSNLFDVADDWGSDSEDDSNANVEYSVTANANLNQLVNVNEPVVNVAENAFSASNLNNCNVYAANMASMEVDTQGLGLDRLNLNQGNGSGSAVRGAAGGGGEVLEDGDEGEEATALIEGSEDDMVAVESPELPSEDISQWFKDPTSVSVWPRHECLREFFLSCDEEVPPKGIALMVHEQELLHRYNTQHHTERGSDEDSGSDGRYVKSVPVHGDVYIQKFKKRIAQAPEQVLRYCRHSGNGPLLLRPFTGLEGGSTCPLCSSPLIFELQVMPQLIPHLLPREANLNSSATHPSSTGYKAGGIKASTQATQGMNINETSGPIKQPCPSTRSKSGHAKSKILSGNHQQSLESVNSLDLQEPADSAGLEMSPKLRCKRNRNIKESSSDKVCSQGSGKKSPDAANKSNVLLSGVVEFGTVLVFTCSQSCWHDKPVVESVHVQAEVL